MGLGLSPVGKLLGNVGILITFPFVSTNSRSRVRIAIDLRFEYPTTVLGLLARARIHRNAEWF